jgi:hypothetical protein
MTDCSHHWMISQAEGPTSAGRCKLCHEVREFENAIRDKAWHEQPGSRVIKGKNTLKKTELPIPVGKILPTIKKIL